jgi:hypothetical protein
MTTTPITAQQCLRVATTVLDVGGLRWASEKPSSTPRFGGSTV